MPRHTTDIDIDAVLAVYAGPGGSVEAAEVASRLAGKPISKRTVQRWASDRGVKSGFVPPVKVDYPSAAAYARGCRSEECVEANRQAQRAVKERRVVEGRVGKRRVPHGTVSGYSNWDCRCDRCRSAWSEYLRERRALRRMASAG